MKPVLAFVGMCGCGKSVASEILEKEGFKGIYFGKLTLDYLKDNHIEINAANEKRAREHLRTIHGMAAYAALSLPKIEKLLSEEISVYIDGLYSWEEYKYLSEKLTAPLVLVAIYTEKNIRYERLAKRAIRPLCQQEARMRDISEIENIQKGGPIAFSDHTLLNNGQIFELEISISKLLQLYQF